MKENRTYQICPVQEQDRSWVADLITRYWGADCVVVHEDIFHPAQLAGFIAREPGGGSVGLVTFQIRGDECEIITLNSLIENQGVGTKLIQAVVQAARNSGCSRLCLSTTNDNQQAIDFYLRKGFKVHRVRKGAMDRAREIKPSIPFISTEGTAINDEWVFHFDLTKPDQLTDEGLSNTHHHAD